MLITRLGHSCFVFTTNNGKCIMVDPFLKQNPACPRKFIQEDYLKEIDTVLLTHGHFDHVSGLEEVRNSNPDVLVIAQYELALKLMREGYNVFPLNYGGSYREDSFEVTMVNAVHTSSFGETTGVPGLVGLPCGYVVNAFEDQVVYVSGDTNVMADMKIIQDIYQPSVAILSCSGQFVMGVKEAAYALTHLLNVKKVIPCHTFPTVKDAACPELMEGLVESFPVIQFMIGQDEELMEVMKNSDVEVTIIGYGETKEL
ncbi:metal-dependent hydrolase [Rossellomorea aquimaris]|uniref:metal-dependent hydrolase n=1 Tax=Rossellomorea aquimaris TaxID=189382 RepID=UPI001CFF0DB3|nr:metal-dependent hydrolase [Rossellomorea aquimaris]